MIRPYGRTRGIRVNTCLAPCLSPLTRMRRRCGTSSGSCATATRGITASCACDRRTRRSPVSRSLRPPASEVALVLAGQWLSGMTGSELLDEARRLHPHAKRGLLIAWGDWGDRATGEAIFDSIARGRIDHYVLRPSASPDELFHQAISSLLLEWAEARRDVAVHDPRGRRVLVRQGLRAEGRARALRDAALVLPGRLGATGAPSLPRRATGRSSRSSSFPTARS